MEASPSVKSDPRPSLDKKPRRAWHVVGFLVAVLTLGMCVAPAQAGFLKVDLSQAPNNSAKGFKSTGQYNLLSIYPVTGGGFGVAFLLPPVPLDLPRGGTDLLNFNQVLKTQFPKDSGWSFTKANADLPANSFVVTADQIHDTKRDPNYVGIEMPSLLGGDVAGFAVLLKNAPARNTHWVQVVYDNVSGAFSNSVDINARNNGGRSPYYDDGSAANATNFLDSPNTLLPGSHYFFADTYLATGPDPTKPGPVTLYNGFLWGWVNIEFPKVNLFGLNQAFNQDLSSVASLSSVLGTDVSNEVSQTDLQTVESDFDQEITALESPEPSSVCLLGLGILGLIGYRWRLGKRAATGLHARRHQINRPSDGDREVLAATRA
jgi:hypothetical protein